MYEDINNVNGDPNIVIFEANILNQVPVMETNNNIPVPVIAEPVPIAAEPIKTVKVFFDRVVFEIDGKTLKNILTLNNISTNGEIKLTFNKNNVECIIVDPAHVEMIQTTINKEMFLMYSVETTNNDADRVILGIDVDKMLSVLKTVKKNETVSLEYDTRTADKTFIVKTGIFTHKVNVIDSDGIPDSKIPYLDLKAKFTINAETFYSFLDQSGTVSDHFLIQTNGAPTNNVYLKASGDINNVECIPEINNLTSNSIHKSMFSTDYVLNVVKDIKKLFKFLTIEISDDNPIRITGDGFSSGNGYLDIIVLIAPRIEEA